MTLKTWAISLEAGLIIEADEVIDIDGELIFYVEDTKIAQFPADAVLGYSEVD